jgi:predicted dehydrogenase
LLFHVTIHDLDLIFWYLNKKVKSVYAQSNSKALKAYNMEDSLFAVLRFEDDTLVNLESTWALPEGNASHLDAYMEILGTQGMAKVDCDYSGLWFSNAATTLFPDTMHWPQVGANIAGDLKEELTHFVNCALQGKTPLVTGEDGVRSLELAWAIQKSIDTGEVIKFE